MGREIRLPDPMPPGLRVQLQFQTFCKKDSPPRSGLPCLAFYTPEVWQGFETTDSPTTFLDVASTRPETRSSTWQSPDKEKTSMTGATGKATSWAPSAPRSCRQVAGPCGRLVGRPFSCRRRSPPFRNIEIVAQSEDDVQREFFESLDLGRPDLATVREAVDQAKWASAAAALADYYRQRTSPPPLPLGKTTSNEYADRICDPRIHLCWLRTLSTASRDPVERRPFRLRAVGYLAEPSHALAQPRVGLCRYR